MTTEVTHPAVRFDVYSHYIKVTEFDRVGMQAIAAMGRGLAVYNQVGHGATQRWEMVRVFAASTKDRRQWRFHRNQLPDLIRTFEGAGIGLSRIKMVHHQALPGVPVVFKSRNAYEPKDYQGPIIDYLVADCPPDYAPSKFVELQTGKGKGFISLTGVGRIGQRTLVVVKGMYVDKWKDEIEEFFQVKPGRDLLVIGGKKCPNPGKAYRNLLAMADAGELQAHFIVVSIDTMRIYQQTYEMYNGEVPGYDINPDELYQKLGIGVRIVDEAHQNFHAVFKLDLYGHVWRTISLSATMVSDDRFTNQMYDTVWPQITRSPKVEFHKYIHVKNLWYSIEDVRKIKCKNFKRQYSHVMFEQSIMKSKVLLANYYAMILDVLKTIYFDDRKPGQKAIVFCATKEMCTIIQSWLREAYPHLKIGRYIDVDPFETLEQSDLTVTTLKSAGTAVDIKNLTRVLCTVAVSSKQANEQAIGRLRPVKDFPDVEPEFYLLSCRQIDKHCAYAADKVSKLDGKVLTLLEYQTSYRI